MKLALQQATPRKLRQTRKLPVRKRKTAHWLRQLHFWLAVVFTLNFLIVVLTGFLVQHRDRFRLDELAISRRWLPARYRPEDPATEIRADIVVTDLHSGRLLGSKGSLLIDSAAVGWLLIIGSGYGIKLLSHYRGNNKH